MRLEWAIPCLSVSLEGGIVTKIENACFDTLWGQKPFSQIEVIVLVRALGQREEFTEEAERSVEVHLSGPGMERLVELQFDLPTGEPDADHPEGWEVNAVVPVLLEFTPIEEGPYMIDFYLNGKHQPCPVTFRVRAGSPPS